MALLGPYARRVLEEAARLARRLHAEEVTSEHLVAALLLDEDAAATRMVLHAFADPRTIAGEVLALCPGILVVGSGRSLPFSVRAVAALEAARRAAHAARAPAVDGLCLLAAAVDELAPELRRALEDAGYRAPPGPAAAAASTPSDEHFFRGFAPEARKALGAACRIAGRLERDSISPAHLVLGCLEEDEEARAASGLSVLRARTSLAGRDDDQSPPARARVPLGAELVTLFAGLEPGASTLGMLGGVLTHGSEELRLLLTQQRITPALYARHRGAFSDPEPEPGAAPERA